MLLLFDFGTEKAETIKIKLITFLNGNHENLK